MNANELADKVIEVLGEFWLSTQCATMLRQQQADLKDADKYALELERLYEDAKAEIEALKSVVYWLKENRPEVWDDIQKWRKL